MSLYIFRFNPAFNMASIKQAINEAVERGMCVASVNQFIVIAITRLLEHLILPVLQVAGL